MLKRHTTAQIIKQGLPFSRFRYYQKDEEVVLKGEEARCLYYVERGSVEVSYMTNETKIVVGLIGAGEFFGEIGFFDEGTRVRDIRAGEDSGIRLFDQDSMDRLQQENPSLYGEFLDVITKNICAKFRRVLDHGEGATPYHAPFTTEGRVIEESASIPEDVLQTREWGYVRRMVEDFKTLFFDLSCRLQGDHEENGSEDSRRMCHEFLDRFNLDLQEAHQRLSASQMPDHAWDYIFREIYPYFMRSRFAQRAYFKPKGYSGDFIMMEMIYHNEPTGEGKLGVLVDDWCLNTEAAKAVRGRRDLLSRQLMTLCDQRAAKQSAIRIMNLGCGSSRELFDFLSLCEYSELIEATCVDSEPEALEYTSHFINAFPHDATIRLMNDHIIKWSLGRVHHDYGLHDIIFSAGFTDYLDSRLFLAMVNRCYDYLKPGGMLIIGNFGPHNPNRAFMDHLLHWKLIYRDGDELLDLFNKSRFGRDTTQVREAPDFNFLAVAEKR